MERRKRPLSGPPRNDVSEDIHKSVVTYEFTMPKCFVCVRHAGPGWLSFLSCPKAGVLNLLYALLSNPTKPHGSNDCLDAHLPQNAQLGH